MNALSRRTEGALRNHRLLSRIKNSNPDHFVSLIHVHFAANLGDHPEKTNVAELLGDLSLLLAEKSKTPPQINQGKKFRFQKKKSPKGSSAVFGVPLTEEIVKRIYPLIRYLNTTDSSCCVASAKLRVSRKKVLGQKRVGLFRKSGSAAKQKELREILNRGNDIEAQLNASHFNPHDVACVLKLFLRLLPEPLLTERHIKAYYLISGISSVSDRTEMLQLLMLLLPPENVTLLRHLLDLLHRTSEEKDNLMDRNALAIVIAPNLFTLRNLTAAEAHVMTGSSISIVTFMIEKANVIFNVPEKLMQDVRSYLQEMPATDVPMNGGEAAGGGRRSRRGKKSDSDSAAYVTNHERSSTWESTQSAPLHARVESLDSMQTVSSHSSGVDVRDKVKERDVEDLFLSKPFDLSTSAKPTTQKKRTRSLGNTLRNIFQRCKSVVHGSPPRLHLNDQPAESNISPMDSDFRVTAVDSDDSDFCCQKQDSPQRGNVETEDPSSGTPQPSLSRVHVVYVSSGTNRQLFSSSSSSDDVPPTPPNSLDTTTSQATCHSTVSPVSATNGQLTPSAAKYRLRKIHPLYHWRTKSGLGVDRRFRTSMTGQRPKPVASLAPRDRKTKESFLSEPQFEVANIEEDNSVFCISLDDYKDDSEWVEPIRVD